MYAKLISGNLIEVPYYVNKDGKDIMGYNFDSNSEMLLADGFKLVEETEPPVEMIQPVKSYIETDDKIIAVYAEGYIEPDYKEKRAAAYPDVREYLDAMVKVNSGDETLIAEGNAQLQTYFQRCLEVKEQFPKKGS